MKIIKLVFSFVLIAVLGIHRWGGVDTDDQDRTFYRYCLSSLAIVANLIAKWADAEQKV